MLTHALLILAVLCGAIVGWLTGRLARARCRHDRLRTIYGDEINAVNGMRSVCLSCDQLFPEQAYTRPTPALLAAERAAKGGA